MERVTQKYIRNLIRSGVIEDGDKLEECEVCELAEHQNRWAYSSGVYGINGTITTDKLTGKDYGFVGRSSRLHIIA